MGRGGVGGRSGGGGGFGGGRSRSSAVSNPPKPVSKALTPAHAPVISAGGNYLLSIMGTGIVEVVTWGFGSSIGHRVGDFVLGPHTIYYEQKVAEHASTPNSSGASDDSSSHNIAFQNCLNANNAEVAKCQYNMDTLAECRGGSATTLTA